MNRSGRFYEKTRVIRDKVSALWEKRGDLLKKISPKGESAPVASLSAENATPMSKTMHILRTSAKWIYHLRKVFMAIPVVFYALKLAAYCRANLPEQVGVNLLASGEFAQTIDRSLAINGSLLVTAGCLVLMFFSRKARYPWIISIFSLVLPLLLLVTNLYPQ